MPGRYIRNTAILAKLHATYTTDPVPTGAANAMLVSNVNLDPLNAQNVDRDLIRPWLGLSEQLVGTSYKSASYDIELAGAGAAGTAPAYGPLLRACGLAEAISVGNRVEYTPISTAFEAIAQYVYDDGVLHKLLGCRGNMQLKIPLGERPEFSFSFIGLDGGETANTPSGVVYTPFQRPVIPTDTNTLDVTLGGTYATGAVTGGTPYSGIGLPMADLGNQAAYTPLLGGDEVDIPQRGVTGQLQLDVTAAQEVALMAQIRSNTLTSLSIQHGTVAGNILLLFFPAVQLLNPKRVDRNGRKQMGIDFRSPPLAGNDEFRLIVK
jgi:hypothetical protein